MAMAKMVVAAMKRSATQHNKLIALTTAMISIAVRTVAAKSKAERAVAAVWLQ